MAATASAPRTTEPTEPAVAAFTTRLRCADPGLCAASRAQAGIPAALADCALTSVAALTRLERHFGQRELRTQAQDGNARPTGLPTAAALTPATTGAAAAATGSIAVDGSRTEETRLRSTTAAAALSFGARLSVGILDAR
jgi:hypothetical protein